MGQPSTAAASVMEQRGSRAEQQKHKMPQEDRSIRLQAGSYLGQIWKAEIKYRAGHAAQPAF